MAERKGRSGADPPPTSLEDTALERALEGLFRLGANRRFDAQQTAAVGAAVTRAGYAVLRSLSDRGSLTLREVAASSAMDAATASRQVGALVDAGLVDRQTAEDDGRSVELTLTEQGRTVYERIVAYRLAHLGNVLDGWTEQERAVLTRLVSRLVDGLATTPVPPTTD